MTPPASASLRLHPSTARAYRCTCGAQVFFRNNTCLQCGRALGFDPWLGQVLAIEPDAEPGVWHAVAPQGSESGDAPLQRYRRCAQMGTPALCNWLVRDDGSIGAADCSCVACRLNRVIPDLGLERNHEPWRKVELARRRLVSQLIGLGLPVEPLSEDGGPGGLVFDTLVSLPGQAQVLTGHAQGVITLNLAEADDAYREQVRSQMREPYRTLLGHYRHEVGHHFWDRLVRNDPCLQGFRALFGDEQQDYAAALNAHYQQGAPPGWSGAYISSYASAHPWEDWAETWAHYLHMRDTLDTAVSFGMAPDEVDVDALHYLPSVLQEEPSPEAEVFLAMLNAWTRLTAVLNELSRSMGLPDFYPFVLSDTVVRKLHFVHGRVEPFERTT
ncbi:MAG: putative zinc-binding metallopeptidase [Hydrogenophaga sp.]|uniref:zinc-binding metallopeptidase family protein n=1 Tax=Hydrogenophaga sp. TaxID=1904254 RepID=UPI0025C27028|nr:putative zinc-binding metallopeptidase [Hydrogenophaga sp.]MBT9550545.1 putative zinc-binding metallopeptidase [Hydrogenophaga sp.]